MNLLLDTHAVLWWLDDDPRLSPHAREAIEDPANQVFVSTASLWEIAIKIRIGKLRVDLADVIALLPQQGFRLLDIKTDHLQVLATLPAHHRDPFDHLLIAQAITEELTFLSNDRHVKSYPVASIPTT